MNLDPITVQIIHDERQREIAEHLHQSSLVRESKLQNQAKPRRLLGVKWFSSR